MDLAGCNNDTKTSYMPKVQGKFDSSCHVPFKVYIVSFYVPWESNQLLWHCELHKPYYFWIDYSFKKKIVVNVF